MFFGEQWASIQLFSKWVEGCAALHFAFKHTIFVPFYLPFRVPVPHICNNLIWRIFYNPFGINFNLIVSWLSCGFMIPFKVTSIYFIHAIAAGTAKWLLRTPRQNTTLLIG